MTPLSSRRTDSAAAALSVVTIIGAVLRLSHLGTQSFWLDEAFSVVLARAPWTAFARELRTREANMGLYFLLLRPWVRLGAGEATVRLLSAIAGIATIPVVATLAGRLFDRRVGLYAALILALDPLHLWASQEARGYSLVVFLVGCAGLAFVSIVDDGEGRAADDAPSHRGPDWTRLGRWLAYVATSALAMYAHFYAAFVLAAHWLSLASRPPGLRWQPLVVSAAAIGALLVPLALFFVGGQHGNIDWLGAAIATGVQLFVGQVLHSAGFAALVGYTLMCVGVVWAAARAARRARTPRTRWAYVFALLWVAVPTILPFLVSITLKPVLDPRYLTVCVPGVALTTAAVLGGLRAGRLRVALVAVLGLELFADWAYFTQFRKEDWRAATRAVLTRSEAGDVMIFYAPYTRRPFDYYVSRLDSGGRAPRMLYPSVGYSTFALDTSTALTLGAAVDTARHASRAWLVLSHAEPDSACVHDLDAALRSTLPIVEHQAFVAIDVRLYRSASPSGAARPSAPAGAIPHCPQA